MFEGYIFLLALFFSRAYGSPPGNECNRQQTQLFVRSLGVRLQDVILPTYPCVQHNSTQQVSP